MGHKIIPLEEFSHIPRKVGPQVQKRIDALKTGQKMQDLPEELWHDSFRFYVKEDPNRKGGPNLRILRLDPLKPSLTVTGYVFNKFVHPEENRFITPREAARLQGFPDDFLFRGTLTSVQRQVGNAVPIQLAGAVARQILDHIEKHSPFGLGRDVYGSGVLPAVSLFSGAGGMDLGVGRAKRKGLVFAPKVCVEFDRDCCATLRTNFGGGLKVMEQDIGKAESGALIENCGTDGAIIPLVFGGPPCQSFSQAGKQKGCHDPRGSLIFEFLRFVKKIKPAYFIMENVSNLRGIGAGALLHEIKTEIDAIGYNFTWNLLCAADYGAPQLRRRIVFIGVRKPYPAVQAPLPTHAERGDNLLAPQKYVGVGEAFAGLPKVAGADFKAELLKPPLKRNAPLKSKGQKVQTGL